MKKKLLLLFLIFIFPFIWVIPSFAHYTTPFDIEKVLLDIAKEKQKQGDLLTAELFSPPELIRFACSQQHMLGVLARKNVAGGGDYCSGQSWNSFTNFRLDFDHTTDNKNACLSSGTETGALTSATVATPGLASPGSGGDALLCDGDDHYIAFDNSGTYFQSQYGELKFLVYLAGDNTDNQTIFRIQEVASQDLLLLTLKGDGLVTLRWEDNNQGTIDTIGAINNDLDDYYGDWVQIHVQWDTTRCTDGTCDGVGEDELQARSRVDDNRDGDFNDGGNENWTAWHGESSAIDFGAWSAEPTTDDFKFGISYGTQNQNIYIDDVEISYSQPTWGS